MIQVLKKHYNKSWFLFIYILAVAIATILPVGYYFGTFDQTIHIPQLLYSHDPSYYPNDPMVALVKYHYSYFWFPYKYFVESNYFQLLIFASYFATLCFFYYSVYKLTQFIFGSRTVGLISLLFFIIPHLGFTGFQINDMSLLNRSLANPLLILSIYFYLKERYLVSFLILGLMFNIHIPYVVLIGSLIGLDLIYRIYKKQVSLKTLFISLFVFIVSAIPVLLWFITGEVTKEVYTDAWFRLITGNMLHFIFYLVSWDPIVIFLTLNGLSILILYKIYLSNLSLRFKSFFNNIFFGFIIILILTLVNTYIYPTIIITKLQILRIGLFTVIFTYILAAGYYMNLYREKKINLNMLRAMIICCIFSLFPIVLLLTEIIRRKLNHRYAYIAIIALSLLSFIGSLFYLSKLGVYKNSFVSSNDNSEWIKTQEWVRDNTDRDSMFITPPHIYWLYTPTFRVYSRRSTVVLLSDIMELAFNPGYTQEFTNRLNDLAPGAINKFNNNNTFSSFDITRDSFYNLNEEDFIRLGNKYNAGFLVLENKYKVVDFPVIYRNSEYSVYNIPITNEK